MTSVTLLRDNNSQPCLSLFSSFKCTLNYCVDSSIQHFKFPKVVQAHTLREVGILGTALLRLYSITILPIFTETGSPFDR